MAKKKLNVDLIPLVIFVVVFTCLAAGMYFGVFRNSTNHCLDIGKEELFLILDSTILDNDEHPIDNISLQQAFYSIDRQVDVDGALTNYGYKQVLEDYYKFSLQANDSVSKKKQSMSVMLLNSLESKASTFKSDDLIINELRMAISTNNRQKALLYLDKVEAKLIRKKIKLRELKQKNKYAVPIGVIATFFVFFYGIHTIKKRR